jgi:ATP-dependent helicase/nuclease subunit B
MAVQRLTTPYGPPALRALREAVDRLQQGDPLAPVTVLVHSNAVGVATRRWLAANGGIAAAQFVTAFRFAELLGGQALAESGKRPVSTPVVDVAVRQVLAASSGIFAAHRPAPGNHHCAAQHVPRPTPRVGAALRHRLGAQRLGTRGPRGRSPVCRRAPNAAAATGTTRPTCCTPPVTGRRSVPRARTVVFLPQRLRPTEQALLDALAAPR